MINFLLCTVLPPWASEVDEIHKFYDFSDLKQFFQIWLDSVLIEMNDANNVIYNNFEYIDQFLKMHRFFSRSL